MFYIFIWLLATVCIYAVLFHEENASENFFFKCFAPPFWPVILLVVCVLLLILAVEKVFEIFFKEQ